MNTEKHYQEDLSNRKLRIPLKLRVAIAYILMFSVIVSWMNSKYLYHMRDGKKGHNSCTRPPNFWGLNDFYRILITYWHIHFLPKQLQGLIHDLLKIIWHPLSIRKLQNFSYLLNQQFKKATFLKKNRHPSLNFIARINFQAKYRGNRV